jgi:hypothetical protein
MAISLVVKPTTLKWTDYTEQEKVVDPVDKTEQDAFTAFEWDLPASKPRRLDGKLALPDGLTLSITPVALVRKGARKSDELLSHEQFHYDVGIVIARVVVKALERLTGRTIADLDAGSDLILNRHFVVRSGLIQRRYDLETRHGRNAGYQKAWKRLMRETLARPDSTQMGGWWL